MPDQNSSFIPKSGVKTVKRSQGTKRIYLLAYISYIFFFSVLFAVIGVYIYGATVNRSLDSLKTQMVEARQRFAVTEIENIKQLDQRLSTAERLLNESTAPSRLLPDIESIVSADIRFSGLTYEQLPNRQFKLELSGEADEFNEILAQKQLLGRSELLADADVVSYDYSVGGEGGGTGDVVLSFVLSDTRDLNDIAYMAPITVTTTTASDTENVVVEDSIEGTEDLETEESPAVVEEEASVTTPN